jgi:hypothetical protein
MSDALAKAQSAQRFCSFLLTPNYCLLSRRDAEDAEKNMGGIGTNNIYQRCDLSASARESHRSKIARSDLV